MALHSSVRTAGQMVLGIEQGRGMHSHRPHTHEGEVGEREGGEGERERESEI